MQKSFPSGGGLNARKCLIYILQNKWNQTKLSFFAGFDGSTCDSVITAVHWSNVLISEYPGHTIKLSWRHVTFPKIDQLYQCWRNSENTLLQIDETRQCNRQHSFPGTSFFSDNTVDFKWFCKPMKSPYSIMDQLYGKLWAKIWS